MTVKSLSVSDRPLTPLTFLLRSASVYPDKVAVIDDEQQWTYREFRERVERLATWLVEFGIRPGDRVAFLCPNTAPMLEAHFAVPLAGGVLVAINTRLAAAEVAYILEHSGSRLLFVDRDFESLVSKLPADDVPVEQTIWIDEGSGESSPSAGYEDIVADGAVAKTDWSWEPANEFDTIAINYTSGTTGRPKGVMYTHRGAMLNALGESFESSLDAESIYLWTLPMFHCNGWCFTWAVTGMGATHVCLRKFDPATAWNRIERHRVTHLNGAPIVLGTMFSAPECPPQLASPLTITTAGAPPSPTLIGQVEAVGARVTHVYGLTETYGPITVCAAQSSWQDLDDDAVARHKARQGVAFRVTEPVRVVDEAMRDVPADSATLGEVVMRGNIVMKGYFDDEAATAEAFRGGWFHSGDLAVMHPDGYIELRDRSKDVIISGGENISSIEVEQVVCQHPDVVDVAVIGVPHEKWGETPRAYVRTKPESTLGEAELIEFCRERLAHFKCPTSIEFGELPRTSTGKVQKFALREKAWEGHEGRIQGA